METEEKEQRFKEYAKEKVVARLIQSVQEQTKKNETVVVSHTPLTLREVGESGVRDAVRRYLTNKSL